MVAAARSGGINDGERQCERDSRAARAIADFCRIWLVPDGLAEGRWTRRCPIRNSLTCDGGCFRWPRTRIPDGV